MPVIRNEKLLTGTSGCGVGKCVGGAAAVADRFVAAALGFDRRARKRCNQPGSSVVTVMKDGQSPSMQL